MKINDEQEIHTTYVEDYNKDKTYYNKVLVN